jgi:hypothetical protein
MTQPPDDDFIRSHTHGEGSASEEDGARAAAEEARAIRAALRVVWERRERDRGPIIWMTAREWQDVGRRGSSFLAQKVPDSVRRRCDEAHRDHEVIWIELPAHEQTHPTRTRHLTHAYLIRHGIESAEAGAGYLRGNLLFRPDTTYVMVMGHDKPQLRVVSAEERMPPPEDPWERAQRMQAEQLRHHIEGRNKI